jgi:hypothetical protein
MTHLAFILRGPRLWLLRWRLIRGRALPTLASRVLAVLDYLARVSRAAGFR